MFWYKMRWALLWALLILVLISIRIEQMPLTEYAPAIQHLDKWVHVGMFVVFSFLLTDSFSNQTYFETLRLFPFSFASLVGLALGAGTELLQHLIFTHRSGDWADFIADAGGIALGGLCFVFYSMIFKKEKL